MKRKPILPKTAEPELQQSADRSIARDEKKKRIARRSPQRDIPRVEGVEPGAAPKKE